MTYFASATSVVNRPAPSHGPVAGLWRMEEPIMEGGKVKTGGMWEHQRKWWNLNTFVKALIGGYGSGKTFIAGKRVISLALQNAPCPVATVSPTFTVARRTMIPSIKELLAGKQTILGKSSFWWKYHSTDHEFRIRYRGREGLIYALSGEDPDMLKGPNLAAALIDEPFIQDVGVFKQMMARIRHPDAVRLELGLTGTPEQLNWGYDLCAGEEKKNYDVSMIQASTRGNLAVAATGYVERLLGTYSGKAADAFVEGLFTNLSTGTVFYAFSGENVVDLPTPEGADICAGMDFNVNPMAATVFWRAGNHVHFMDELELPNADTEYMCGELVQRFPKLRQVYPDASGNARKSSAPGGKTDFWYITQAGLTVRCNHANPPHRDSFNAVNGKLKPAKGVVTLTISPRCHKLRKYLSIYSHELLNTPAQKQMSHLLDAFRYPVTYLFPVVRETVTVEKLSGA